MTQSLPPSPKSSTQYAESLSALHSLIANFVSTHKDEIGCGFAYNDYPDSVLSFITLRELQAEGAGLIGINDDLYAQLIDLLQAYDIDAEYVSVIRVEKDALTRFIIQTGSLDENAWQEIISEEEIRLRETVRLKIRAEEHIADLKALRAPRKGKRDRRK